MKALTEEEILNVNFRIPDAVSSVLGLQRVLLDVKNHVADSLPAVEHDFPEKLTQYALALSHAHTLYGMATRASDPVPALVEEGMKLRSFLFSDARALVHRGFAVREDRHAKRKTAPTQIPEQAPPSAPAANDG